ncbi:MAG: hypothetical protein A3H35_19055 [Betaproteobacteria bacterium RIFCSPLOWO2_02_FULL_62_17]|nr:MAG: hypothetical protein A3H35_19055 [Betaproteobacteria bacterium RIFCSPLOWO2_02_FULL_62_17]
MQHSDFIPASHPVLADPASCDKWLERERFTDSNHACAAFIGLLDALEDAPPQAPACVLILEKLRAPVQAALDEQSRRYAGRALPLAPAENAAFISSCDLWLAQTRAWRRLFRASFANPALASDRARLALRTLECIAGLLTTEFAARREIDPTHWQWLHQGYALAEKENLAQVEVGAQDSPNTTTCAAVYAHVLLVHLANCAALAQREFLWAGRWARRWASKVRLWRSAQNSGGLAVNLEGMAGAQWTPTGTPGAALRFVDCAPVARSIRSRLQKLAEGAAPETLGLGKDCPPSAAQMLLNTLLHCWSDAPQSRQFPRRSTTGTTELVTSFAGIHQAIADADFDGDGAPWDYSRNRVEQIQVFQRVVDARAVTPGVALPERWQTLDESANGFRLRRGAAGVRLAHRQLVAVRPGGASQFILCEIRWLTQGQDNSINIGAKALPGLPQACAVRPIKAGPLQSGAWTQAFALPLSKGLAPNLVLPIGWYQQGHELDLKLGGEQFRIRLDELVERGHDYHRVRFAAVSSS